VLKETQDNLMVQQQQDLQLFLMRGDYTNAVILAMGLGQPYRLLKIFTEIYTKNSGLAALDNYLCKLGDDDVCCWGG
jgi:hypothetical protein